MHHPHRCARSRRPQQVAEPTQSVKRCADHRVCQPAELRAAAHRGRAVPGVGELRTWPARRGYSPLAGAAGRASAPRSGQVTSVNDQARSPPDIGPCRRQPHAGAGITGMRDIRRYVRWPQKEPVGYSGSSPTDAMDYVDAPAIGGPVTSVAPAIGGPVTSVARLLCVAGHSGVSGLAKFVSAVWPDRCHSALHLHPAEPPGAFTRGTRARDWPSGATGTRVRWSTANRASGLSGA